LRQVARAPRQERQAIAEPLQLRGRRQQLDARRLRDGRQPQVRFADCLQRREMCAAVEPIRNLHGRLQRREFASDERRGQRLDVRRPLARRPQRRELAWQARIDQLVQPLRLFEPSMSLIRKVTVPVGRLAFAEKGSGFGCEGPEQ
jgi:hypothetical protein